LLLATGQWGIGAVEKWRSNAPALQRSKTFFEIQLKGKVYSSKLPNPQLSVEPHKKFNPMTDCPGNQWELWCEKIILTTKISYTRRN